MRPGIPTRLVDVLWLLAFGVLGSLWCLGAGQRIGPTFDEPFYLQGGMHFWHTGSLQLLLDKGTMPLPVVVCTAPVRAFEWYHQRTFALTDPTDFDQALRLARPATLLFWWLLLGYGWWAGARLAGPWGGRLAVALLACEPTLLAHGALATTDVALSACLLALAVHFQAGRQASWWRRVGLCALLYALALLAKASALAFGVLVMLALEMARLWQEQPADVRAWPRLRACVAGLWGANFRTEVVQVVGIGLALTFLACGSDFQPERSFVAWSHGLPEGPWRSLMAWLADHLIIFSNAGAAIVRQIKHNMQGHGAYLLGIRSPTALWYYFPVALTIKLAVPMLVLPVALALLSPRSLRNWALGLALVFLLFSLNCRVQIGVRLVMPLIVFGATGLGAGLAHALARADLAPWRRRTVAGLTALGLAGAAFGVASVWPHGLCFVNELYGGTRDGYLCVSGSDYDWGQGVREVENWQRDHGRGLALLYYGTDPAAAAPRFLPLRPDHLPGPDGQSIRAALGGNDLAVSVCLLHGPSLRHERLDVLLAYLRTCEPIDRTTCFFIYHFPPPESSVEGPRASAAADR
jgi:hypothetical protein